MAEILGADLVGHVHGAGGHRGQLPGDAGAGHLLRDQPGPPASRRSTGSTPEADGRPASGPWRRSPASCGGFSSGWGPEPVSVERLFLPEAAAALRGAIAEAGGNEVLAIGSLDPEGRVEKVSSGGPRERGGRAGPGGPPGSGGCGGAQPPRGQAGAQHAGLRRGFPAGRPGNRLLHRGQPGVQGVRGGRAHPGAAIGHAESGAAFRTAARGGRPGGHLSGFRGAR